MYKYKKNPKLKDIGEVSFINLISHSIKTDASVVYGIGDDTAVLKYTKDKYLLFTCDMIIEAVHFTCKMKPEDIGYKALACNISDIASMGGIPKYAIISLGLPVNLSVDFVNRIYKGIKKVAGKFNINIVGGDTNRTEKITINIALLGEIEKNKLTLRSKARIGDLIFVSNFLGSACNRAEYPDFVPRVKEARYLVNNYKINSMIDISDGLVSDLGHIVKSSGVGADIYEEAIPKPKDVTMDDALYAGEDYELLFTLSKKEAGKLINNFSSKKGFVSFSQIGVITSKRAKIRLINNDCFVKILKTKGYRHF